MPKYQVITYPNRVLTQKAEPVQTIGDFERELVQNMIQLMHLEGGVGIAAPQVGVSTRIFIVCHEAKPGTEIVLMNPVIFKTSGEQVGIEGCLSLPGISGEVRRARHIEYEYMNWDGKMIQEKASDFPARVIQHELDHLDGKLLIDRVDFDQRQELLSGYQRL